LRRHKLVFALAAVAVALAAVCASAWLAAPSGDGLAARVDARAREGGGRPVSLDRIAPIMRQAVVATEDERFYRHHGIDLIGVLRALPYDLAHVSLAQGASTITEQLAKVDYLAGNDHTPWRKLEDAALAVKLENRYTKEQLLAGYLNSAYFGHGAYGIRAASERYFGVRPGRLALPQAALLAGLIQAPSAYDPIVHPAAARERQLEVLGSLVRDGVVTGSEAAAALARPLSLRDTRPLPPVRGVSFAAPPAFVWWQLIAGLIAFLGGLAALLALRRLRHEPAALRALVSVAAVAIVVLGAALAVRAFRAA
jgi:membrane peptidoglycan carboxypeptidase